MLWHGAWVSKITGSDRQPCYLSCLSTFLNRCSLGCLNANVLPYRWGAVFQLPWWSGQCSVRWVMYNSSGVPWFFSPDNSPCAQHSVSWSQTCRRLYATDCLPSWEHDTGTLPVTFLIILQMNFPWLVEWELTPVGGTQPFLVFSPVCCEENQHSPGAFKWIRWPSRWPQVSSSSACCLFLLRWLSLWRQQTGQTVTEV